MKKQLLKIALFTLSFVLMAVAGYSQANTVAAKVVNVSQSLYIKANRVDSISIDGTFGANSDNNLTSQKAIKTYVNSNFVGLIGNQTVAGIKTFSSPLVLNNLTSSGVTDSILTLDPVTKAMHWRTGTITLFAANGLSTSTVIQDSFYLGGFLIQNTAINLNGFTFSLVALQNKSSLLGTDSVIIGNAAGQLFKVPASLFTGGGGAQNLQQVFTQQNAAILTVADTINTNTNSVPLTFVGGIQFAGKGLYSFGDINHVALNTYTRSSTSDGSYSIGAATGGTINQNINGITKDATLSTGQKQWAGYVTTASFTLGTPVGMLVFDASGNIGTQAIGGGGSQTLQQVFAQQANNAILTSQDSITGRPLVLGDSVIISNTLIPSVANGVNIGTATRPFLTVNADGVTAFANLTFAAGSGGNIVFNTSGSTRMQVASGGQLSLVPYTASSSFPVTAVGMLVFDASGNVGTQALPSSSSLARQSITTGTTATGTSGNLLVTFNPASTISTFNFTMPASPTDQQVVEFETGATIGSGTIVTSLTITPNAGQSLEFSTALTTLTYGEVSRWKFRTSDTAWVRQY